MKAGDLVQVVGENAALRIVQAVSPSGVFINHQCLEKKRVFVALTCSWEEHVLILYHYLLRNCSADLLVDTDSVEYWAFKNLLSSLEQGKGTEAYKDLHQVVHWSLLCQMKVGWMDETEMIRTFLTETDCHLFYKVNFQKGDFDAFVASSKEEALYLLELGGPVLYAGGAPICSTCGVPHFEECSAPRVLIVVRCVLNSTPHSPHYSEEGNSWKETEWDEESESWKADLEWRGSEEDDADYWKGGGYAENSWE